jgi:CBS domain-containing protein
VPIAEEYLTPPLTVSAEASARDAGRLMERQHLGYAIVVEGERPVGIVTDRDLVVRVLARRLDPATTPVVEAMTSPLVTLPRELDLIDASRAMRRHGIRRLPIVDGRGGLVGMLVADELVRLVGREVSALAEAMERSKELEARPPEEAVSIFGKE